ncbi:glycosyltransferase family 4 protein [Actinokineospora guangxiensis]|uniref:Glycosyltransferase family 4 protein n=1 Tax=Actinokineospora guangxiensis TaxID=1490288 RepID=A0ABW0EL27_9PSEU
MRVLLIAEKYPPVVGGGETHLHQLAEGLVAQGNDVVVLTEAVDPGLDSAGYRRGAVEVREIAGLVAACTRLDCKDAVEHLHQELTTTDADVVHVFNYVPALLVSWLRTTVRQPLVVSLFETFVPGGRVFDLWGDWDLERALQRGLVANLRPDLHLCGSRAYEKWAREAGFTEPASVVEFGTDLAAFTAETAHRDAWRGARGLTDEFLFLIPARPVPRKRIEDAIAALAEIAGAHPRARLVLTSPTGRTQASYAAWLSEEAERRGVSDRLRWEDGLSWRDMPALYAGTDAVVLPSSHEGWGIALTEGMASRRPVITTDVEAHQEVVTDEETGLLYPAGDTAALAQQMRRVLSDDLSGLVERAHREAHRRFSAEAVVDGHIAAYRSLVAR